MTEAELKALAVAREVHCNGETCPGPVLKAMDALGEIGEGEVALLVTDVKAAVVNVSVAVQTGGLAEVLGVVKESGLYYMYLKRL